MVVEHKTSKVDTEIMRQVTWQSRLAGIACMIFGGLGLYAESEESIVFETVVCIAFATCLVIAGIQEFLL